MKIALIGYGKMGKAIEQVALQKGHSIVAKIDQDNLNDFIPGNLQQADAAIEFTSPHSAFENIKSCIEWGVPVVSGSTGWTDRLNEIKELVKARNGAFIYASNFSIGVNIFFEVNKKLASLMAPQADYDVLIEETHHTQKKDAPSGTAITLAEQVLNELKRKKKWVNEKSGAAEDLSIVSYRTDPAPGTHSVRYTSSIDDIEIVHTAHSRSGFAAGAVLSAEFLAGKKGCFTMKDVLNL